MVLKQIKNIARSKGIGLKDIALHLGITYSSLYNRLQGNVKLDTIKEIAHFLNCEVHELIPTGPEFAHFYDNGEWLGIRRKK